MKKYICIKDVTKSYGSKKLVLNKLNLDVFSGEVFGLIGRNGVGKTTLIKCITGITPITSGDIKVLDKSINTEPIEVKRNIGYVSDNQILYDEMTGKEYVEFIASVFNVSNISDLFKDLVNRFELNTLINDKISTYSHGTRQKVSIIAALIHQPSILILDEPFEGLDVAASYELKTIISSYKKDGKTVFLTSHNIGVVEKLCDRVAILKEGTIKEIIDFRTGSFNQDLEDYFYQISGITRMDVK